MADVWRELGKAVGRALKSLVDTGTANQWETRMSETLYDTRRVG